MNNSNKATEIINLASVYSDVYVRWVTIVMSLSRHARASARASYGDCQSQAKAILGWKCWTFLSAN